MAAKVSKQDLPRNVPWRAIAFDLDDTLYPESEFVRSGFREVGLWSLKALNFDPYTTFSELIDLFEGGTRGTLFNSWVASHGLSADLIGEMVSVYRKHCPNIEPFPGVREMLTDLRKEFRLGLLSDGLLAVQERKLAALGIEHLFDAVVFSDRLGRNYWKPSVKPFLELMHNLKVRPEETVYVGDNPIKDFVACKQLGMHSIWIRQANGLYSGIKPEIDARPDCVVDSIEGVADLLKTGHVIG
jgi:putative hydrolase of the HAD superfamily